MPCYNVAKGTTSKAISVGAWVDSKLSLVAMMMAVVEKSKKVDECVTKGNYFLVNIILRRSSATDTLIRIGIPPQKSLSVRFR